MRRSVGAESQSAALHGAFWTANPRGQGACSSERGLRITGRAFPVGTGEALAVPRPSGAGAEADDGGSWKVDSRGNAAHNALAIGLGRDMRIDPEISGVSIVAVGDFSPAAFHPAWFSLHGLLSAEAAEAAKVHIVSPEATEFEFDWLTVEVTTRAFSMTTLQEPYVRVRDLAASLFGERLPDPPVRALGINRTAHFRVRDMSERDRIGRALAPTEAWGKWAAALGLDGHHGGMTSLTMTQVDIDGRPDDDIINVKVEPSVRIGGRRTGVYVIINDHYTIKRASGKSSEQLRAILDSRFDESRRWSDGIIDHVMSLAEGRND